MAVDPKNSVMHASGESPAEHRDLTGNMRSAAGRLRETSRRIAQNSTMQSAGLQEINDVSDAMAVDLARSLEDASAAAARAHAARERVDSAGISIEHLVESVETLAAGSRSARETMLELVATLARIDEIVAFVGEVSARTNMLALNAAIEAARAGEHGRGFAVVASEVRKLADSTAEATKRMENLLRDVRAGTERTTAIAVSAEDAVVAGDRAAASARSALDEIGSAVRSTEAAFAGVQSATADQATRADQFGRSAAQLLRTSRSHVADAAEAILAINAIDFHLTEMETGTAISGGPVIVATALAAESLAGRSITELARRLGGTLAGVRLEARSGDTAGGKGELGILSAVRRGETAIASIGCAIVGNVLPAFQLLELPYLLDDRRHVAALLDGPYGQELLASLRQFGLVGLGYLENGFRHMTNGVRPIRTPADMRRLRIRVVESPVHIAIGDALETIATPIPLPRLRDALRTGEVDGQHNPLATIHAFRLHEVQKHLTLTSHMYTPQVLLASAAWYDALGDERKRVDDAVAETIAWERREADALDRTTLAELNRALAVVTLDPAERAAFVEATRPVYDVMERIIGKDDVARVRRAADDARVGKAIS